MKKIVFVLAVALACGLAITACSPEKKGKKSASTITIEVTPSTIGEITSSSPTRTLTAVVKNNGVVQPGASVSWVVSPSTFGFCSPNQGASTLFTADTSKQGQGTIVASYSGTNSAAVQFSLNEAPIIINSVAITPSTPQNISSTQTVTFTATAMAGTTTLTGSSYPINWTATGGTISPNPSNSGASVTFTPSGAGTATVQAKYGAVNSSVVNVVVGSTVPVSSKYLIYSDAGLGTNVSSAFGKYFGDGGDTAMAEVSGGCVPDPSKAQRVTFNGIGWAGWYIPFSSAVDLSAYTKMVFYAKNDTGAELFRMEFKNSANVIKAQVFQPTTTWTKYEMDITSVADRTSVTVPINIVFAVVDNSAVVGNVYIDYVYFE